MAKSSNRPYSAMSLASAQLLGDHIRVARRKGRMSARELAERLGASRGTVSRMESGDLRVAMGLYFEACFILGIPLWGGDSKTRDVFAGQLKETLALLPEAPRVTPFSRT